MGSIKNVNIAKNMSQLEKDITEIEALDDYIQLIRDYIQKQILPRLPPNSFENIKLALETKNINDLIQA